MRVVVIAPPVPVVSWEEAKRHLKLDDDDQRAEVEAMVAAATGHIDGPDGWLGRALGAQTLEARIDEFDCRGLFLPFPPIVSITSVKYLDTTGIEQTLAADQYDIFGTQLAPAWSKGWPSARCQREAVRVRYQAGYAELPAPIRAAILLMVGDLFRNRTTVALGGIAVSSVPMSTTVENLLSPFRVWR